MSGEQKLAVAQVSPRHLGSRHEVDEYVTRTSAALAERGHRVLVAAPSDSRSAIREGRKAIKAAAEDPAISELLERVVRRELDPASAATELLERQDG